MAQDFNIETLLGGFPSNVFRKTQPGVYEVKGGSKRVGAQKADLLQQLFRQFPNRLLWLKDVDEDLKSMLGSPLSIAGGASLWVLTDATSLTELFNELYEGGWAMFFLPHPPRCVPTPPESLPTNHEDVRPLLRTLGASVGILSWYDDIEWLIVSLIHQD